MFVSPQTISMILYSRKYSAIHTFHNNNQTIMKEKKANKIHSQLNIKETVQTNKQTDRHFFSQLKRSEAFRFMPRFPESLFMSRKKNYNLLKTTHTERRTKSFLNQRDFFYSNLFLLSIPLF